MSNYPSIYSVSVFDLHNKVKSFLDKLNGAGQIDLDPSGYPYLISSRRQGANFVTQISRNNQLENFVLNPRKQSAPIISWNYNDGFQRPEQKQVVMVQAPDSNKQERGRRAVQSSTIEHIIEQLLKD